MPPQQQPKNSPQLWDKIWGESTLQQKEILYTIAREKNNTIWQQIKQAVLARHGTFDRLRVIELGAGAGTFAVLMAEEGARVTILDYSINAIARSQTFFNSLGIEAEFIQADALTVESTLNKKYDISMSFGLAEHFQDAERLQIIQSHFDLLDSRGSTFISVPNSYCLPYRFWKKKRELQGKWAYGEEYPFSRQEFRKICTTLKVQNYSFLGSSFPASLNYILPFSSWRNSLLKRIAPTTYDPLNTAGIRQQKKKFLDQYLGYALILSAEL